MRGETETVCSKKMNLNDYYFLPSKVKSQPREKGKKQSKQEKSISETNSATFS